MVVAIHQPNFLPFPGFFSKIVHSDVFVILDRAAFSKGSYTNRVKVLDEGRSRWITVPVRTAKRAGQEIREVEIDRSQNWERKILGSIRNAYSGMQYFEKWYDLLGVSLQDRKRLIQLNTALIYLVLSELNIPSRTVLESTLDLDSRLKGTVRLIEIVRVLGGDCYLSGFGGMEYQDESLFGENGIELKYRPELPSFFRNGLSILDALVQHDSDEIRNALEA
jgi:hypothetical protein